jgi:ssDNA-binding Zn-finger/Zn-ribbon topoisomerase 1
MSNRQKDFLKYRKIHSKLTFESFSYSIDNKAISIRYNFLLESFSPKELPIVRFEPSIQLALNSSNNINKLKPQALENLVFQMGMVELISYWKAACPPVIIIKPFRLNKDQVRFWKKLYWNGLGEFFYVNGIETNLQEFVHIQSESSKSLETIPLQTEQKIIIPIGGGKDSAVSLEILKDSSFELLPFIINPRAASLNTVKQANLPNDNILLAKRTIDPTLIELNKQGYLNGHTPFSAMLAFTTLLQAYVSNAKFIALSNESSANEPSVADSHVNHQYSKTFEFESDFIDYYKNYISADIEYFSFLRPLSELQIACLFAKLKNHHYSFRSCNVGSKTDSWCCNCPKCQFTYIMLAPFLPEVELNSIIGENLIIKPSLETSLKELRGLTEVKPFECVGTVEEVNLALYKAINTNYYPKPNNVDMQSSIDDKQLFANALKEWNHEHFLPKNLETLLKQKLSVC